MGKMIGSSMMTDAASQDDALEALKAFNTAITTARLYPADAPQVPAAAEKAYLAIKNHLRKNGDLVFSMDSDEPLLCGEPIQKQTLGKLHGADVFQHLKLLGLPCTVIRPGMDRKIFRQILIFFVSPPQRIRKEGGAEVYAAQLGLADVFPQDCGSGKARLEPSPKTVQIEVAFKDVKQEWISFLLGKGESSEFNQEIFDLFTDPEKGARLLTATLAETLLDLPVGETIALSRPFEQAIEHVEELLNRDQMAALAPRTAALLLDVLNGPDLETLMSQTYTGEMGESLLAALLTRIGNDELRKVIAGLQRKMKGSELKYGKDSSQFLLVSSTLSRLLGTPRGKQFLALEKTRLIMEKGERERRNKRIQAALTAILRGNFSVLENEEIALYLPQTVERLLANGKDDVAGLLIEKLTKELLKGDEEIEPRLSRSLALISEILVGAQKWEWLDKLTGPLLVWVKEREGAEDVYKKILSVLQHIMLHGWRIGNTVKADLILHVFFDIRSGNIKKPESIRVLTSRVQDQSIDRSLLPELLSKCLADPSDEALAERLSMQGPVAARFLISRLLGSDNAGERIKILDLLSNMGPILPPVIVEQLPAPMPWFGKRNLLKLLAETGTEENVDMALEYLGHDDLRVQREAFVCIYKISRDKRKTALLRALPLAGESMKVQVVKALSPLVDDQVAEALADLLMDQNNFSQEIRGTLIKQTCRALANSSSQAGVEALQKFIAQRGRGSTRRLDLEVWKTAENALRQIEGNKHRRTLPSSEQQRMPAVEKTVALFGGGTGEREYVTDLPEERLITEALDKKDVSRAKILLVDLIGKVARSKQFGDAEKLRDWLIQIDPFALMDIIRTAEIIENEKTSSIDKDHLEAWFPLYDVLTTEEFNALYYALDNKQYASEEIIAKQGDIRPVLYFINSGRVKLYYDDNDTEILIKIMGRGEIVGGGSFFDASVWTMNMAALGFADISVLKLEKAKSWRKDFPSLEAKLQDFCLKFNDFRDYFQKMGKNRRLDDRKTAVCRVTTILLDRYGKDTGISSKGELTDISTGGASFFLHITQKKNARLLLGRNVRVVFPTGSAESDKVISRDGLFVAINSSRLIHNEYSAHVSFDQPLEDVELQGIIAAGK